MGKRQFRTQDTGVLKWLNACFDLWIEKGFVLWSPGHKISTQGIDQRSIIWSTYDPKLYRPTGLVWSSVHEYLDILRSAQYSALLFDGSIIQITVDYAGLAVVGHRFAYFPCPIWLSPRNFDEAAEEGVPLDEYLREAVQTARLEELRSWPTMRFDFVSAEVEGEPVSHLHFGPEECRVPVLGPVSLSRFLEFIGRVLYSSEPPVAPTISLGTCAQSTMRLIEREPIHIGWPITT